jgi:hypothetical protein
LAAAVAAAHEVRLLTRRRRRRASPAWGRTWRWPRVRGGRRRLRRLALLREPVLVRLAARRRLLRLVAQLRLRRRVVRRVVRLAALRRRVWRRTGASG